MLTTLRSRITAVSVAVVTVALLLSTVIVYEVIRREDTLTMEHNLAAITEGNARSLSEWLSARVSAVDAIASESLDGSALPFVKQLEQSGGFIVAFVGYPDRRAVFSRDLGIPADYDPTSRPWYKEAVSAGKLTLTAPYTDISTHKLVVTLARPVLANGQLKGVVGADVNLDAVTNTIKGIHPSASSFAFVIDNTGRVVAHPNAELNLKPATELSPELTADFLNKLSQSAEPARVKLNGSIKLLHAEPVANSSFSLVVAMDESEALQSLSKVVQAQALTVLVVALLSGVIVAWLTASGFKRLHDVQLAMEDIGSEHGDLTKRLPVVGSDEVAKIARAFNTFADKLTRVLIDVRDSSTSVHGATAEIVQGNQDLSSRTEQAASSLEETAASMEQLTGTVQNSAASARQAGSLATEALSTAQRGGEAMSQVVSTMQEIAESSTKIQEITSVIDSIAFQTNLLALNAAVEAARAGEQGRGFAVVAAEVRGLAGRSAEAAKQIKHLIEDSVDKVNHGTEYVQDAGKTVSDVVTSVRSVESMLREIAATAQEQSDGILQINQAVNQLDSATQQNAALVEEATAAATFLNEQAKRLAEAVGQFKLS